MISFGFSARHRQQIEAGRPIHRNNAAKRLRRSEGAN
jgi:hypothetical protein